VPIQRLMLHHIVFSVVGKQNPACQTFTGFDPKTKFPASRELHGPARSATCSRCRPATATGWARTTTGDDVDADEPPTAGRQRVHRVEGTYDTNPNLTAVHPYWLDIQNCRADPIFNVPGGGRPGSIYSRSYTFTMPAVRSHRGLGGHVHGGAKNLVISQPDCGDRKIIESDPAWGMPDNAFYHVRPILHEPRSDRDERDDQLAGVPGGARPAAEAHRELRQLPAAPRVMGISLVYVAPSAAPLTVRAAAADIQTYTTAAPPPHRRAALRGGRSRGSRERPGAHDPAPAGADG